MVLTLYSSTAGMFKLPIISPLTALAASNQVHCAGGMNCSHRTNLSDEPSQFFESGRLANLAYYLFGVFTKLSAMPLL